MNKCKGCGVTLQTTDSNIEGYVTKIDNNLCERCFKIRHYNEYQKVEASNLEFISHLKEINKTKDLVLLVVDMFQIYDLDFIKQYIKQNIVLVLTKRDLLPERIYEQKILDYFDSFNLPLLDKVIISSKSNYNLDLLYEKILKYKKSKYVYVVGYTNAGKSTLINQFIDKSKDELITTSNLPSTTLNKIEVSINENLILVDTPGILVNGSVLEIVDSKDLKKIVPKKRIKPVVYQVKTPQSFKVDEFAYLEVNDNTDLVFYMANTLEITRFYKKKTPTNFSKYIVDVKEKEDILINGLGFIKVMKPSRIELYLKDDITYTIRKSFI